MEGSELVEGPAGALMNFFRPDEFLFFVMNVKFFVMNLRFS